MNENKPNLGLATTRELLNELTVRIEVDGKLDYRTVGDLAPGLTDTVAYEPAKKDLPEGQRVVRTKSSGDRVYLLDDNKKSRQWVTNPKDDPTYPVLTALGFKMSDVVEVEDGELLKYTMGAAVYRVE